MKAFWKDTLIAQSSATVVVEGNHYFPPDSLQRGYFQPSAHQTVCPWKGVAHYYDVVVGSDRNANAAWYYPQASEAAKSIEGYVAFWRGVRVVE